MVERLSAVDRIAQYRQEYVAIGDNVTELSDLELLNQVLAAREGHWRATEDMVHKVWRTLEPERQRLFDAGFTAATQGLKDRADRYVRDAFAEWARPMSEVLGRIAVLPDRPKPIVLAALKGAADRARTLLYRGLDGYRVGDPRAMWEPTDHREIVMNIETVVSVLKNRRGLTGEAVLDAITVVLEQGQRLDVSLLTKMGTPPPHPTPTFVGSADWHKRGDGSYYERQHPSEARVVAYQLGDRWNLALWSPAGRLLADGSTTEDLVAALADELLRHALPWSAQPVGASYPWRRFADLAKHIQDARSGSISEAPSTKAGN
ncbi:hypothetical protein [Nocardia sp. NPDC052566]|uniref:hypothetical protein n=1 Tax=Nocardia sp. NPDC052566 TaxID=3364330 RepID=UPI0037C7424A